MLLMRRDIFLGNNRVVMPRLLVMPLLADTEERPAFSAAAPWPRLAGGEMSTTMPTARLGSAGRDAGCVAARKPLLPGLAPNTKDSGLDAEPEEI